MSQPTELGTYLGASTADGYPVTEVRAARCTCGGDVFHVHLAGEDTARRTCVACGVPHFVCDSEEYWEDNLEDNDGEPDQAECPCGNDTFQLAVGYAFRVGNDDIKWLYVGLQCTTCSECGLYADWKIDYSPSLQLLEQA